MGMASPAAPVPVPVPPWVILGRIVALVGHGAVYDHGVLSTVALEQHDCAKDPEKLSVAGLVQNDAIEDPGNIFVAPTVPPCVSTGTAAESVHPKPNDTDKGLSDKLAMPLRFSTLTVPEGVRPKHKITDKDLSDELAMPLGFSTLTAPEGVHPKPNITDKDLSDELAMPLGFSTLTAPEGVHPKPNITDKDLSDELAMPLGFSTLTAPEGVHPRPNITKTDKGLSDELGIAMPLRSSTVTVPKGVHLKPNIDDTEKHPYVVAIVEAGDLSAALPVPQRVSRLNVPTSLQPKPSYDSTVEHPYVVAAGEAGLLLHVSRFDINHEEPQCIIFIGSNFLPADAEAKRDTPAGTAKRLPDLPGVSNIENVGLLSVPGSGGAEFVVAELRLVDNDHATLFTFRSGTEAWLKRNLNCPSTCGRRGMWSSHDVIAHDGKLWWVNLVRGLLSCDPLSAQPVLCHVPLPSTFTDRTVVLPANIESSCIVKVSEGKLRHVDMALGMGEPVDQTAIVIRSLEYSPLGETQWKIQSVNILRTIWDSESYKNSGMPEEVPALALLHPSKADVVYFFIDQYLFSVNLTENRVAEIVQMQCDHSSAYAIAWELPPSLENDMDALATRGVLIKSLAAQSPPLPKESTQSLLLSTQSDEEVSQVHQHSLRCLVCLRHCDEDICSCCTMQVKRNLLDISKTVTRTGSDDLLSYCLECHELVKKNHHHVHEGKIIPLDWYEGELVAWVTGKEKWAVVFHGIQSDWCFRLNVGRPFLIHQQKAIRCMVCNDVLTLDLLYGSLISFCSVKCWLKSGSGGTVEPLAEAMVAAEFSNDLDAICLTCNCVFSSSYEGDRHAEHDWFAVITDSGQQSRVQIPPRHNFAHVWHTIKGLGACWTGEILIKDDMSQRCQNCRARLVDGGGENCSLQCSLPKNYLLPRPLLLRHHHD